jgi:hypothetical protein
MIKKWFQNLFKQDNTNIEIDLVKEAVVDYRNDGKELMRKLAEKHSLDIENEKDYETLISRSNEEIPRKGELSKRWNYCFHGCECGFYNKKHQQQIEVVLSNAPEFGHIDSWFLLSYMESTEKYKHGIKGVKWQELKSVIEKLYKTGKIKPVNE